MSAKGALAVTFQPLFTQVQVHSQVRSRWGTVTGFTQSTALLAWQHYFTNASNPFIHPLSMLYNLSNKIRHLKLTVITYMHYPNTTRWPAQITNNYYSVILLILLLLLLLLTAIGLSPGGSGYFTCIQNMKMVTNKFKSGGLHEKHVVATWNLGNHLSICLQTQGNQEKPVSRRPVAGPSEYWLASSPA